MKFRPESDSKSSTGQPLKLYNSVHTKAHILVCLRVNWSAPLSSFLPVFLFGLNRLSSHYPLCFNSFPPPVLCRPVLCSSLWPACCSLLLYGYQQIFIAAATAAAARMLKTAAAGGRGAQRKREGGRSKENGGEGRTVQGGRG